MGERPDLRAALARALAALGTAGPSAADGAAPGAGPAAPAGPCPAPPAPNPFAPVTREDREERAAILEYDHGLPRAEAERRAGLLGPLSPERQEIEIAPEGCPPSWWRGGLLLREAGRLRRGPPERAAEIAADLLRLLREHGAALAATGWTAEEVAGLCPVRPLSHRARAGLAPRLKGRRVLRVTAEGAEIEAAPGAPAERLARAGIEPGAVPAWALVPAGALDRGGRLPARPEDPALGPSGL